MKYDRDTRSAILAQPTPTDPERIAEMYREEDEREQFHEEWKRRQHRLEFNKLFYNSRRFQSVPILELQPWNDPPAYSS